jgi:PBSX family phage portal protein
MRLPALFTRQPKPQPRAEVFAFGDPESVLTLRDIIFEGVYLGFGGLWYETPIPFTTLAKSYRATAWHGSAIQVKRNILAATFQPHPLLSREAFEGLALDYLVFGNAYLRRDTSRTGRTISLQRMLAKYMRRGADLATYYWLPDLQRHIELPAGTVNHLKQADVDQDIYGLPDYLGGMQSTWLNEAATLFRRRYYLNGSHAGFILYVSDEIQDSKDVDKLRESLRQAKGVGNFRNLFLYSPKGKKDGVQVIPIAEVAAKDEFWNLKNVTRDDQLAAHRIPPQLMGVVPSNASGFGDAETAARIFVANELAPLQSAFTSLNADLGAEIFRFSPYQLPAATAPAA